MKNLLFLSSFLLSLVVCNAQDQCTSAITAVTGRPQKINTSGQTKDDVNGGACNGITIGETPGAWMKYSGTGGLMKASTCHADTKIKVKMTVFLAEGDNCDKLKCLDVSSETDFECDIPGIESTRIYFDSMKGRTYYVLIQQADAALGGIFSLNFVRATPPQNNDCVDAIGPVPRDGTIIPGKNEHASISNNIAGYCDYQEGLYPGVWYQVFGNGGQVILNACGIENLDGFSFSIYKSADCSELECVAGKQGGATKNDDKCFFETGTVFDEATNTPRVEGVQRDSFQYSFPSQDGIRYYVYLHHARTEHNKVTSPRQRFWVIDGEGASSAYGASSIGYRDSAYGMGPYKPGKNNRGNMGNAADYVNGGGSGDTSILQRNRVAAISSFVSFAFLFM